MGADEGCARKRVGECRALLTLLIAAAVRSRTRLRIRLVSDSMYGDVEGRDAPFLCSHVSALHFSTLTQYFAVFVGLTRKGCSNQASFLLQKLILSAASTLSWCLAQVMGVHLLTITASSRAIDAQCSRERLSNPGSTS